MGEKQVSARLSNCGKVLRAFATAFAWKHSIVHQGNDLGYSKNAKDWIICSQVLRAQKAYGCSSTTRCQSVLNTFQGLRYSLALQRWSSRMKGATPPRALRCFLQEHGVNRTTGITGLWQPSVHSDVAF